MKKSTPSVIVILAALATATPSTGRDWLVPAEAPTIQAAVDSSFSGDVVVVAPGVYTDCSHPNGNNVLHIAVLKSGVSLRGATGDPADVVLDAGGLGRCLEMRNFGVPVSVEGVTLRAGRAPSPFGSGGGVFAYGAEATFRQVVFDSCWAEFAGGGVSLSNGDLQVENCVFVDCSTDNIGGAIRTSASPLAVTATTIHRTGGPAIHYAGTRPGLDRVLITGGDGVPLARNSALDPEPDLSCCDFWDNGEDWPAFIVGQYQMAGNFSADPVYCNALLDDLSVHAASPCAPESGTCGGVGAGLVGCGTGGIRWHVAADGSGDTSTIQAALLAAAVGDTVILADGIYTGDGNRDLDFLGKSLVLMGGSGDPDLVVIDCGGSLAEPHRGVVFTAGASTFTEVRDLTIRNADTPGDGGALLVAGSPRISNVVMTGNHADRGAAVFVGVGSPRLTDCLILENEGRIRGGGIAATGGDVDVSGTAILRNWGRDGGPAVDAHGSASIILFQCTLTANNSQPGRGAVETADTASVHLDHSIVASHAYRSVRCEGGFITAANTDIWDNAEGDWTSCLAGQSGRDGNFTRDPLFCDSTADDLDLRQDSSCTADNAPDGLRIGAGEAACAAPAIFGDRSALLPPGTGPGYGAAWLDLNADGLPDPHVSRQNALGNAALGAGPGTFVSAEVYGGLTGPTRAIGAADWDADGDLDYFLGNENLQDLRLSTDAGVLVLDAVVTGTGPGPAGMPTFADLEGDGGMDLFVTNTDSTGRLFSWDPAEGFQRREDLLPATAGDVRDAAWADHDDDGDLDLFLACDGGPSLLLRRDEEAFATLTVPALSDTLAARSGDWADYDNDGDLDLYVAVADGPNLLLRNDGGSFVDAAAGPAADAGASWSGVWGDWDNDGDEDLFVANEGTPDRLLRNDGDDRFTDVHPPALAASDSSRGAAWADYDLDGDLDVLVSDPTAAARLLGNDGDGTAHWLQVDLVARNGAVGALGTRLEVVAGGERQVRIVGGGGWYSHNAVTAHFGLGEHAVVDSLIIRWTDGSRGVMWDVAADQRMLLRASEVSAAGPPPLPAAGLLPCAPNPCNPRTLLRWRLSVPGHVRLRIYDVAGRLVATPVDAVYAAGRHAEPWTGRDQRGAAVASGVYFVRMEAGDTVATRRLALVR